MPASRTAVCLLVATLLGLTAGAPAARADEGFPFGSELTMDAARMPGSKRIPDLEIGDNGEVVLEGWCKAAKGQFSVAGNTVIFVAGRVDHRDCQAARAQADDELLAALAEVTTWRRQGDLVTFNGPKTLRFRLKTN